ncbi:MAG: tetratricopeptide repeat protein [Chitinophagaceae bacterium]|nr:tetratricopeptide repeat protein [Chitinophagaceae bacterium]MBN8667967.1 tetratricopeptide repeat protein [Chitinophagales bacterium]
MAKPLAIIFLVLSSLICTAQDAATLIKEADQLEASLKEAQAYEKFKQVLKLDHRNYYALWKCSELCSRIGRRQATKEKQLDYYKAGKIFAETAIKVDPNKADGYYALSVAMGRFAMTESGNEKVKAVKAIKDNADKAVTLNPNHGRAWHVVGKWHYEVSNLNAVEKAALKIFYGGLPKSSLNDAIAAYEKAMKLEPNFALNNLEMAKAYHRNKQNDKAIALLKALPSIPEKTEDDKGIKEEGKKLLEKWSK